MEQAKKFSLKTKIIGIVLLGWLVPFLLVAGVVAFYVFGNHLETAINQQEMQMAFNVQTCEERLNASIFSSKIISYDSGLNSAYQTYQNEGLSEEGLIQMGNNYLHQQYRHDDSFRDVILWFYDQPEKMRCEVYNVGTGGGYQDVRQYWDEDHQKVTELVNDLGTQIKFLNIDGRLYLIRNLVDYNYQPIAAMVARVNTDYCFGNLTNFVPNASVSVELDGQVFDLSEDHVDKSEITGQDPRSESGYIWKNNVLWLFRNVFTENYDLTIRVRFNDGSAFTLFEGYQFILIVMIIFLLPLLYIILRVFKYQITVPVSALVAGATRIEEGALGYQMKETPNSQEFQYLVYSFNRMSETLKYQFDHIYEEEIALLDARFMALQSNINPHFMNNTLEIINWEARLSGNHKVSQMIGALSTLLDAAMDRNKKRFVLLSEEMIYVNAYLYITSERFGERLKISNLLSGDILQLEVPRLILQPVIENAIEHGALRKGNGSVVIEGYQKSEYLYIEVTNEGVLSEEQKDKISSLLAADAGEGEANGNLGIMNVNQRLKILYGDSCGLSIWQKDEEHIIARLTILAEKKTR